MSANKVAFNITKWFDAEIGSKKPGFCSNGAIAPILMAGCEALGIDSDLIPDIGMGLSGGIGLQGKTCGILTGSAMVLSLAVAQKETQFARKRGRTFAVVGSYCRAFEKECGGTDCRTLCGLDLTTREGIRKLMQSVKADKCARLLKKGAGLLAKELQTV